ncbi:MAG TPA: amidohydrolase, partial [Flammeovirgaceae bacterium]|nr:amidohydrolase [Flammeovirgaceae bacterium]
MALAGRAQIKAAPDRSEGEGPFNQLIIRGATLINGTGAPPFGPVDVVVKGNRIARIVNVGYPGLPIDPERRPKANPGDKEIDAHGMYLLPGFIDMHGHIGGTSKDQTAEYVFKLWLAHGITTIRDPSCGNGLDWVLEHKRRSARNEITAPRIFAYTAFGQGAKNGIHTPEEARAWVQQNAKRGADG